MNNLVHSGLGGSTFVVPPTVHFLDRGDGFFRDAFGLGCRIFGCRPDQACPERDGDMLKHEQPRFKIDILGHSRFSVAAWIGMVTERRAGYKCGGQSVAFTAQTEGAEG